jgi:hypothetical protein
MKAPQRSNSPNLKFCAVTLFYRYSCELFLRYTARRSLAALYAVASTMCKDAMTDTYRPSCQVRISLFIRSPSLSSEIHSRTAIARGPATVHQLMNTRATVYLLVLLVGYTYIWSHTAIYQRLLCSAVLANLKLLLLVHTND